MKKYKYRFLEPTVPGLQRCKPHLNSMYERKHYTNNGHYCQLFESKLKTYLGVKHCILVNNGTSALMLALKSMNLKGDVLVPSFTFAASVNAIKWAGLNPVFVDINPHCFTACVDDIRKKITRKTCAILAVNALGTTSNINILEEIARSNNLKLIFDSAAALGCKHNGKHVGTFGDAECFSLHTTKICCAIEGGVVTTNNDEVADEIKKLRNFGLENHEIHCCGLNAKISEMHSIVGMLSLEDLKGNLFSRESLYVKYKQYLNGLPIQLQKIYGSSTHHIFSILTDKRDELMNYLEDLGIQTRIYYSPLMHHFYHPKAKLPVTEEIHKKILCLPFHLKLNKRDIHYISNKIRKFYD